MSAKPAKATSEARAKLLEQWRAAWPQALAVWSKFTRLRDPRLCTSRIEAALEGLNGSFAMIRLVDQSVVIDLEAVCALGLEAYAVEILAHEIGHHVLAPGSVIDQFRLLARIRKALPTLEHHAAMVANLYTDLYINDRLQRQCGLRMADIYQRLARAPGKQGRQSAVWALYVRIYENLWKLDKGSLGGGDSTDGLDTDAWLGARLIRVYAHDWMNGSGRFATLLLHYLVEDQGSDKAIAYLLDTTDAAEGCEPYGAHEIEADEIDGAVHPVDDRRISGLDEVGESDPVSPNTSQTEGQTRQPFEYGEILKAAGIKLSDHDIAVRYYRERALPHLIPFPAIAVPESPELQLEGLEAWDIGDPLDEIDWLQSVMLSPRPIPGLTTVRRMYGRDPGSTPEKLPVDLDLYVDSSGSMPNPQVETSYLALAGAIIALSALRAGSNVQVTLWSGKSEVLHTQGFIRDEDRILSVLTGFFGGGTCFPIHRLRDTFCGQTPRLRPTHILMISDEGITTMFDEDEKGNSGWDISAKALAAGGAGGTMALSLPLTWDTDEYGVQDTVADLKRARCEQNWAIHPVAEFADLIEFARAFSRHHYAAYIVKQGVSAA
jgi:hypothetical protein